MKIAVVALGKIGLPLAVQFARKGHSTVGVDINRSVVESVNLGLQPFPGEAFLQEYLTEVVGSGRLRATTDYSDAIPEANVVVIVVPLFVDEDGKPDFASMDSATKSIAANLSPDTLVLYETTLPVGTTRSRWKPLLETGSGLEEGSEFHVAFSPERVLTGRVFADLRKYPKLVGGLSPEGSKRAIAFYESVLDFDERPDLGTQNGVWDLGSTEASEMAKLAETTYRDVNIALANQFAIFADRVGVDIFRVIDASNSQPYSHIHRPGIAVGGHCIPVYPRIYLSNDPDATVVSVAREVNAAMPKYMVDVLHSEFGDLRGARVAVLGAAYRGGVKETAFSGVFPIVAALEDLGATPSVHDPLYSEPELRDLGLEPFNLGGPADAVILHTDHQQYRTIGVESFPGLRVFVDGRNIVDRARWTGVKLRILGIP